MLDQSYLYNVSTPLTLHIGDKTITNFFNTIRISVSMQAKCKQKLRLTKRTSPVVKQPQPTREMCIMQQAGMFLHHALRLSAPI